MTAAGTREDLLRTLYAEVLGVPAVGPGEGFFDAGGDSVLAVRLVARAREAGLELSVRDVFDHQTAAELAAVVRTADEVAAPEPGAPLLELSADELAEFEDPGTDTATGTDTGWEVAR